MKKLKSTLSVFIVILTILSVGSPTVILAENPSDGDGGPKPGCVRVFSVRCPWVMGDCCVDRNEPFNCVFDVC
jgi:hypothetical protein